MEKKRKNNNKKKEVRLKEDNKKGQKRKKTSFVVVNAVSCSTDSPRFREEQTRRGSFKERSWLRPGRETVKQSLARNMCLPQGFTTGPSHSFIQHHQKYPSRGRKKSGNRMLYTWEEVG